MVAERQECIVIEDHDSSLQKRYLADKSETDLFGIIMESVSDVVGISDENHLVTYMSPAVKNVLGYDPMDLVGKTGDDFAYFEDLPTVNAALEELQKNKETVFEYRCKHKDGHYIWLENKIRLIFNAATGKENSIFVARDISHRKAVEASLMISEKRFQTYFNSRLVGVSMTSRDGNWITVNERLCLLLGYSKQELLKLKWQELTPADDLSAELETYHNSMKNKESGVVFEKRYVRKDGSIIHTAISAMAMYDNAGEIEGYINVITDVTDKVNAYNEITEVHRQLNNLLSNLPGMAYRCKNDSRWTMLFVSKGCLELTEYQQEALVNNKVIDYETLIHPDDRNLVRIAVNKGLHYNEGYQMTYRMITRTAKVKWVWEQGNGVIVDGQVKFLEGFVTDVTDAKAAERELAASEQKLANLNTMKDKFFAIIAHDLKNPIFAIISLTDFLRNGKLKVDQTEQNGIIRDIHDAALNTYSLLDNLLEWSQTQTGGLECNCERISLIKLTSECIGWIQTQAENKNIQIQVLIDDRIFVHADYRMLATALRNILSNAIKFTHKGGKVVLTVEVTGMYTKIHIKDEGIGMSREQRENIFRIDKRSSSYGTENEPGSGLGLILSKELIEKHNGILSLESKLGAGSTFTISLPQLTDNQG